jgi:hypothetical protein
MPTTVPNRSPIIFGSPGSADRDLRAFSLSNKDLEYLSSSEISTSNVSDAAVSPDPSAIAEVEAKIKV